MGHGNQARRYRKKRRKKRIPIPTEPIIAPSAPADLLTSSADIVPVEPSNDCDNTISVYKIVGEPQSSRCANNGGTPRMSKRSQSLWNSARDKIARQSDTSPAPHSSRPPPLAQILVPGKPPPTCIEQIEMDFKSESSSSGSELASHRKTLVATSTTRKKCDNEVSNVSKSRHRRDDGSDDDVKIIPPQYSCYVIDDDPDEPASSSSRPMEHKTVADDECEVIWTDDGGVIEVDECEEAKWADEMPADRQNNDDDSAANNFYVIDIVDEDELPVTALEQQNNDDVNDIKHKTTLSNHLEQREKATAAAAAEIDDNDDDSVTTASSDRDSPIPEFTWNGDFILCKYCRNHVRNLKDHYMWIHSQQYQAMRRTFFAKQRLAENLDLDDVKRKFAAIFMDIDRYTNTSDEDNDKEDNNVLKMEADAEVFEF